MSERHVCDAFVSVGACVCGKKTEGKEGKV